MGFFIEISQSTSEPSLLIQSSVLLDASHALPNFTINLKGTHQDVLDPPTVNRRTVRNPSSDGLLVPQSQKRMETGRAGSKTLFLLKASPRVKRGEKADKRDGSLREARASSYWCVRANCQVVRNFASLLLNIALIFK